MKLKKIKQSANRGQAMAEYVLILAVLTLVSAVALAGFKEALSAYTNRIITRVQDDTK